MTDREADKLTIPLISRVAFVTKKLIKITNSEMNKVVYEIATTFGVEKDGFFTYDQFIQMMNR